MSSNHNIRNGIKPRGAVAWLLISWLLLTTGVIGCVLGYLFALLRIGK